jgi:hypothetical protein
MDLTSKTLPRLHRGHGIPHFAVPTLPLKATLIPGKPLPDQLSLEIHPLRFSMIILVRSASQWSLD